MRGSRGEAMAPLLKRMRWSHDDIVMRVVDSDGEVLSYGDAEARPHGAVHMHWTI